jgi:pyridoxamine 5'-phosphate oxidase
MSLAPWRTSLSRALHRNRALPYARYFQLATVHDRKPANRTVVFRGFLEPTNQLKIIADQRSEKIGQLLIQPEAEICWYFPKTREQFRLAGPLKVIQANEPDPQLQTARRTQWQELSDNARLQFDWPMPKQPRAASGFEPPPPDPTEPLSNFCLLLFNPLEVDHLELRGEPQNRCLYRCLAPSADQSADQPEWSVEAVNP